MNTENPHSLPAAALIGSHVQQAAHGGYSLADDAAFFAQADWITDTSVKRRILLERAVIRHAVQTILAAKSEFDAQPLYSISVYDGQDTTVTKSRDEAEIMGAIMTTDDDVLRVYGRDGKVGYIRLIYGNDGWDVMADCSVSLGDLLQESYDFADACGEVL